MKLLALAWIFAALSFGQQPAELVMVGAGGPASAAKTLVQTSFCGYNSGSPLSGSNCNASSTFEEPIANFGSATTAGHLLIAQFIVQNPQGGTDVNPSATGSSGASFTRMTFTGRGTTYCLDTVSANSVQYFFYLPNAVSQTNVAVNIPSDSGFATFRWTIILYEVSGASLTSPLDVNACNDAAITTSSNGTTSGSATTGSSGDFLAGGFVQFSGTYSVGTTVAWISSFSNTVGWSGLAEHYIQPSAGSIAATATSSTSNTIHYSGAMAAFK